jgi:hypothetical protein
MFSKVISTATLPRLDRLHAGVEVVDVDFQHLPVRDCRKRIGRLAREIGHHPNDERKLNLLFRTIGFDIVFDLNAGCPVPSDELLTACSRHDLLPS